MSYIDDLLKNHIGKKPVFGKYPDKPEDAISLYKALQEGIIPVDEKYIQTYKMNDEQGYEYISRAFCVPMTPEEHKIYEKFDEDRKQQQKANKAAKKEIKVLVRDTINSTGENKVEIKNNHIDVNPNNTNKVNNKITFKDIEIILEQLYLDNKQLSDLDKEKVVNYFKEKRQSREGKENNNKSDNILGYKNKVHVPDYNNFDISDRIICFDTETTGIGKDDEILQLTAVELKNGEPNVIFSEYFKPRKHTSWEQAMRVNHITPQMVNDKPYILDFVDVLERIFDSADYVAGYNVLYDLRMLKQDLGNNINIPEEKVIDMMDYFKYNQPEGHHKLIDAVTKYCPDKLNWFEKNAHDASADAIATLYVLKEQAKEQTNELER